MRGEEEEVVKKTMIYINAIIKLIFFCTSVNLRWDSMGCYIFEDLQKK